MFPLGSGLGKQAYDACWMEFSLAARRMETEGGSLFGRRGEVSTGWSVAQTRQAGFFSALCVIWKEKRYCVIFPEGKGLIGGWNTLADSCEVLE